MSEFFPMDFFTQFHFMRPEWLVLIIPAIIFTGMMLRQILRSGDWSKYIDPALQSYMLDDIPGKKSTAVSGVLAIAWIITIFALAGPSFEKKAVPVVTNPDALVILLDMSLSMGAQDVAPSRAVRAVRKATDIVRGREDGVTAVVAYAGDAHTVVPFTDDSATVEHLITSLSPEIMPKLGSRPDKAISNALKLMRDAGISEANILLLTDGIQEKDVSRISPLLSPNVSLSLIAIGTNEGAPIPTGDQGFLKDGSGNIVLPRLNTRPMQSLYEATGSRWRSLTYNDSDWQGLTSAPDYSKAKAEQEQMLQTWIDSGFWLIFLILPVALFSFRRGVVFMVLLIPFLMTPEPVMAGMWETDDQQAAKELKRDPAAAAELFTDKAWRGTALYRAGKYDEAADAFNTLKSADAAFNRGNSLAMAGDLVGAIDAYEEALKKQPEFPAATKNLERVKQHLEEQEQQQQDSGDSSDEQNQDGEQGDQQDQQNSDSSSESNSDSSSGSNSENSQSDPSNQNSDSQESDSSKSQQDPSDSEEGRKSDDEFAEQKAQEQAQPQEQTPAENSESSSTQDRNPNDKQADAQADEQEASDTEAQAALDQEQPTNDAGDESDAEALDTFSNLSREERAAMDSLLNQVPDNPGLLMQRKFLYQYRQNTDQTEEDVLW